MILMGTIPGLYKECLVPVRLVWFRVVEVFLGLTASLRAKIHEAGLLLRHIKKLPYFAC